MKKALLLLACTLTVLQIPAFAQINSLPFDKSNCTRFEHAVHRITVFDQRPAKEEIMGWMKVRYTTAPIVAKQTLKKSLEQYFLDLSKGLPSDTGSGLLLILHRFYLSERDQTDKTAFHFAADYFIPSGNNRYLLLGSVDTIIRAKAAHLKQQSLSSVDNCICFLYEQLFQTPVDSTRTFSPDEARNYLNEQKNKIPAYGTAVLQDGVYQEWDDFLQLHEKEKESLVRHENKMRVVHATQKKASFESGFARVYVQDGVAYYNFEGLLYPMEKKDNDFFVRVQVRDINRDMVLLFGLAGVLIEGSKKGQDVTFLIDYKTGRLFKVKDFEQETAHPLKIVL